MPRAHARTTHPLSCARVLQSIRASMSARFLLLIAVSVDAAPAYPKSHALDHGLLNVTEYLATLKAPAWFMERNKAKASTASVATVLQDASRTLGRSVLVRLLMSRARNALWPGEEARGAQAGGERAGVLGGRLQAVVPNLDRTELGAQVPRGVPL